MPWLESWEYNGLDRYDDIGLLVLILIISLRVEVTTRIVEVIIIGKIEWGLKWKGRE